MAAGDGQAPSAGGKHRALAAADLSPSSTASRCHDAQTEVTGSRACCRTEAPGSCATYIQIPLKVQRYADRLAIKRSGRGFDPGWGKTA